MSSFYEHLRRDDNAPETAASRHARCGEQEPLIALIAQGEATAATLSEQDPRGYTVLHELAQRQRSVKAMLEAVLATGTNPNVQDHRGQTPLHHAARINNTLAIKALIAAGAALNVRGHGGNTAFQVAFRSGHDQATRLLMAAGADLNVRNEEGELAIDDQNGLPRHGLRQDIHRIMTEQERVELRVAIEPSASQRPDPPHRTLRSRL